MVTLPTDSAVASSAYSADYPAANAIDGDLGSIVATLPEVNAWLSVRVRGVPSHVAVYNRGDGAVYQAFLGSFEVWLGASSGATAARCGYANAAGGVGPFVLDCRNALRVAAMGSGDLFVTLRETGVARHLTPAELVVYGGVRAAPPLAPAKSPKTRPHVTHKPHGVRANRRWNLWSVRLGPSKEAPPLSAAVRPRGS